MEASTYLVIYYIDDAISGRDNLGAQVMMIWKRCEPNMPDSNPEGAEPINRSAPFIAAKV